MNHQSERPQARCRVGTCTGPVHPAHDPCCSSHGEPLCCEHYRRFHFVETSCGHAPEPPEAGLEPRYHVKKVNDPDGKHDGCRYFVLDPQHDPIARDALLRYSIRARMEGHTLLADDLDDWLDETSEVGR